MCKRQITAVMLAVVILFSGLSIGQLNIARAAGPTEDFTVTGTRYEGDSYGYSETVRTSGKIKKVTVNSVSQGSATAEILDDYSFRVKFSGGSSYTLTGGATDIYEGTVITDCINDAAYIEVPINKYVTEIIDIRLKGQGSSPKSSWEISHPDGSRSVIRFKAENGRYIPHYWYKTVTNIPASKIKDNTYLYTLPYTYTYYVENLSDKTKAALSSRILNPWQLVTKNGTVGTDKDDAPNYTLINDDPLKWGGAGWDRVLKVTAINGTLIDGNTNVQGHPYWNAVKIYYKDGTPNYDFKIAMQLDRWEFIPVIEYKFQSKQFDYSANVTVEYEDIAGPQAYFTAPAEVGVSETFTVVEDSKTPEGTTITGWTWEISSDGEGSWESLSWGHGTFTGSFNSEGERLVRLKVENNAGQESDWYQRSISVMNNSPNQPPVSRFDIESPVYVGFDAWIRDRSYDPDGTIVDVDYDSDCPDYGFGRDSDGDRTMKFYVPGDYTVTQEVEDDRGATASSSQGVEVLPVPEADIDVSGRLRANRKVVLSSLKSVASPDDPIDHTRDTWTITPVNPPAGLEYHIVNSGTPGMIWLQSNKACKFTVSLIVRTRGGDTDDASMTIHIEPDTPPVANVMVKSQAIRDPENGTKAIILPVCDTRVQEGDYISSRTWYYKYDTDNDGSFSDEAWIIFSSGNNPSPIFETASRDDVGKYLFRLDVEENWRDDYISAYVTADDFLTDNNLDIPEADRTVEVLNIPPIFSFTPVRVQKADVLLLVPEDDRIVMENKEIVLEAQMRNGEIAAIDPEIAVDTFVGGDTAVTRLYSGTYGNSSYSTTLLATNYVFVYSTGDNKVVGRKFSNGAIVFEYPEPYYINNNNLYVKTTYYKRINPDTGTITCSFDSAYSNYYIRDSNDDFVIMSDSYGNYALFNNVTGTTITTGTNYITSTFDSVRDVIYIATKQGIKAFDSTDRKVFEVNMDASSYSSYSTPNFTQDDDNIYYSVHKSNGILSIVSIDKSTGNVNWVYNDPAEYFTWSNDLHYFNRTIEGHAVVIGDTLFVHRYNTGMTRSIKNKYYHMRSTVIGININTGTRKFRDILVEQFSAGEASSLYGRPAIENVGGQAFAATYRYRTDDLVCKKYNSSGDITAQIADYYTELYGFLNNDIDSGYFFTRNRSIFKFYDIAGDGSLISQIRLYTYDNDRPFTSPIKFNNYPNRFFTYYQRYSSQNEVDIIDILTGENILKLNTYYSSDQSNYTYAFENIGGDYIFVSPYGGKDTAIASEGDNVNIRYVSAGWHDRAVISQDSKYFTTALNLTSTHYIVGFKISKLFYESIEKIKSIPQREGAARYVAFFTEDLIKYDEKHLELLFRELYKVNAKVVFFGDDDSRIVGEELANATGGIFMEYTDYDDALAKLDNYIKSRAAADTEKESEIALLLNEEYIIESDCYDYENDTIIAEEWLYEHDPAYFENSLGLAPYHLVPQAGPRSSFQHTGLFKTTARVQDRPKADARFSNYWLWSLDTDPLWLYVHRWPVADVEIHAQNPQDELGENKFKRGAPLVLTNNSYDPDAQSRPDRGIVNTKIEYKKLADDDFTVLYNYSTFTLAETGQYVFRVSVDDYYGVWSEPQYIFAEITDQASTVFSVMATVEAEKPDFTPANIPASENLLLKDITTVCNYAVTKVDVRLYTTGGSPVATLLTLNNPADVAGVNGNTMYWKNNTYNIPATLPDSNYIIRFVATNTQGHTASLDVPVRVNTPVTIDAYIDGGKGGGEYEAGDVLNLTAYTNVYASSVKVNVSGNWYILTLMKDDGYVKTWRIDLEIPSTSGSGNTDIVFTAAASNGKTATEILGITVRALRIEDFQITHMVNHPIHEGKFPIAWNSPEVPVKYKAGYYITFKARVKGGPDTVKLRISYFNYMFSYDEEFDMVKEYEDEEGSVWSLRWYADSDKRKTPKGTIINTRLRAIKDGSGYNFNEEENWDGDFIEVYTSAEGDFRIDQVYSE
ncbi:MAG: hypothetical protein HPY70_12830 [Firmicutes bacterium]|nr:hypothetical protein [Bacillota bacterium]